MLVLKKKYEPCKPKEVREFAKEIARMSQSGPAGANQAQRAIKKLAQTADGRKLLAEAAKQAHVAQHSLGANLSSVKGYGGSAARNSASQLSASAYASGNQVSFAGGSNANLLAHELTHIVQQKASKGEK